MTTLGHKPVACCHHVKIKEEEVVDRDGGREGGRERERDFRQYKEWLPYLRKSF